MRTVGCLVRAMAVVSVCIGASDAQAASDVSVVVCAAEAGLHEGAVAHLPIVIPIQKGDDGELRAIGEWNNVRLLGTETTRFTLVGANFLVTVYHRRGAYIGVEATVPLLCKDVSSSFAAVTGG